MNTWITVRSLLGAPYIYWIQELNADLAIEIKWDLTVPELGPRIIAWGTLNYANERCVRFPKNWILI